MDKILFINACVRPMSRTYKLASKVLDRIGGEVTELELSREGLEPLDWKDLQHRLDALEREELSKAFFGIQDILRFGAEGLDMVSPKESEKLFEAAMKKVEQDERL